MKNGKFFKTFNKTDLFIYLFSLAAITVSFFVAGGKNPLALSASLIGATSLIFCAKGNPAGQFLMLIFSALYGVISYRFEYYGEMITYLGMTAPMALLALISWIKNPSGSRAEVKVNSLGKKELLFAALLTAAVTAAFYFILKTLDTKNLFWSTVSVATSFSAAYLTFRRSAFFALLYALNDAVLIILWALASANDISYISVTVCFIIFFFNDVYGFLNWLKMKKRQRRG